MAGLISQLGDDVFAARGTNQRAQAALAQGDVEWASALAHNALAELPATRSGRESRTDWKPWPRYRGTVRPRSRRHPRRRRGSDQGDNRSQPVA
jgi:hypothetical protein